MHTCKNLPERFNEAEDYSPPDGKIKMYMPPIEVGYIFRLVIGRTEKERIPLDIPLEELADR